jgi:hypothetical protein
VTFLSLQSLVQLHEAAGHVSATDMEKWLERAGKWSNEHRESIGTITDRCVCCEASKRRGHPTVSRSQLLCPVRYGDDMCVGIVYLRGCPFVHSIDRFSTVSDIAKWVNRSSAELVRALNETMNEFRRTTRKCFKFKRFLCDPKFSEASWIRVWIRQMT